MSSNLDLSRIIANMQTDLLLVFEDEDIILTNNSFNKFFGASSTQDYNNSYGAFINNFVPHPSYFHNEKIQENKTWFESIMELDEIDRVVSMLSPTHEPHAFSVRINTSDDELKIVTFTDITQTLIKRIMTENKTNIDRRSGAYTKQYFLQVKNSFEEAALFNEKIIVLTLVDIKNTLELKPEKTKEFVTYMKGFIRQDDMLVKYSDTKFILAYLVDDEEKVVQVSSKLKMMLSKCAIDGFTFELRSQHQKKSEKIKTLINSLLDS